MTVLILPKLDPHKKIRDLLNDRLDTQLLQTSKLSKLLQKVKHEQK